MKYNPKINEQISAFEGFSGSHPNQTDENVQGCLEVMYNLQNELAEITGLRSVSLAPLAGAQGEYAGLLVIRAYHIKNGRKLSSFFVNNPESAAMAGLDAVTIKTTSEGDIDIADLKEKVSKETAVLMLTLPSTLGLLDRKSVV